MKNKVHSLEIIHQVTIHFYDSTITKTTWKQQKIKTYDDNSGEPGNSPDMKRIVWTLLSLTHCLGRTVIHPGQIRNV